MSLIGHSKQIKGGMAKVYTSTYTGKGNLGACSPWKILLIRRSEITSEAIFSPQISAILSKKNFNQTLIVATYLLREVVANRKLRITYIVYVVATNGKHTLQQRYCSKIAFRLWLLVSRILIHIEYCIIDKSWSQAPTHAAFHRWWYVL